MFQNSHFSSSSIQWLYICITLEAPGKGEIMQGSIHVDGMESDYKTLAVKAKLFPRNEKQRIVIRCDKTNKDKVFYQISHLIYIHTN